MFETEVVRQKYSKTAGIYDSVTLLFRLVGFTDAWRKRAVRTLNLRPGSTVLDLGCGTGLNFPFLQEAVGPKGEIIGLDLSFLNPLMERVAKGFAVSHEGWR